MTKKRYGYEETHRTVKGVKQKFCTKCKQWKEESEFHKDRAAKDGLSFQCGDCGRDYERKRYRKDRKHVKEVLKYEESHRTFRGVKEKLCCRCRKWKGENKYCRSRRSKDGLQWQCKECESKYCRKRYEQIKKSGRTIIRNEDSHRLVNGVWKKLCNKCRRWKKESDFYRDNSKRDGLTRGCKKCSYEATNKSRSYPRRT